MIWLRTSKCEYRKNEEALTKVKEKGTLLTIMLKRKGNWMGHVTREKGILITVLEGTTDERRKLSKRLTIRIVFLP